MRDGFWTFVLVLMSHGIGSGMEFNRNFSCHKASVMYLMVKKF